MNKITMLAKGLLLQMAAISVLAFGVPGVLSAQAPPSTTPPAKAGTPGQPGPAVHRTDLANHFSPREIMYYQGVWGVDSLKVKYTESGEMIRFSYRVVDPEKAVVLNDKNAEPSLSDPEAGVKLVVPEMEKVGKLRQSSTPIAGKTYWMAFANGGRRVKPGHRVIVEIGHFHAAGLEVE